MGLGKFVIDVLNVVKYLTKKVVIVKFDPNEKSNQIIKKQIRRNRKISNIKTKKISITEIILPSKYKEFATETKCIFCSQSLAKSREGVMSIFGLIPAGVEINNSLLNKIGKDIQITFICEGCVSTLFKLFERKK